MSRIPYTPGARQAKAEMPTSYPSLEIQQTYGTACCNSLGPGHHPNCPDRVPSPLPAEGVALPLPPLIGVKDWVPKKVDETFLRVAVASPYYSKLEKLMATEFLAALSESAALRKHLEETRKDLAYWANRCNSAIERAETAEAKLKENV